NVRLAIGKAVKQLLMGAAIPGGILVPTQQTGTRKAMGNCALHLLCSQSEVANTRAIALWAMMQHFYLSIAIVAKQHMFCRVIRQRYITVFTHHYKAAVATQDTTGRS